MNKARHFAAFRALLEITSRLLLVLSLVNASWADAPGHWRSGRKVRTKARLSFLLSRRRPTALPQKQKPQKLQKLPSKCCLAEELAASSRRRPNNAVAGLY